MAAKLYLRAGDGDQGPLREMVSREELEAYLKHFGDFCDLWMPWKSEDQRPFGFVTFVDHQAAQSFVAQSPHQVPNAKGQLVARFKRSKADTQRERSGPRSAPWERLDELEELLQPLKVEGELSWKNYFASRGIKHALMNIARATDEAYLAKLRASSLAMTGKELPNQEKKLYLFCGPPGTGKTFGMKIIAAECGLDAYQLKLKKIDYDAPDAFRRALQRLQDQSARSGRSVAVFVDEAEVLFGSRASMQDYHSVLVTQKKQIVTEFLTWVDGLETKASGAASVILIMATNLESSMDEAILSRVAETVHFDLPHRGRVESQGRPGTEKHVASAWKEARGLLKGKDPNP
ncbi:unnamed protein product [Durusdinium trenchii]|uniref:AAA+ ATPase domain-containing protein n=1 Tax=Durusdinium trenchii TaxID=1381693 RepID=A0ABP0RIX6_9DINO